MTISESPQEIDYNPNVFLEQFSVVKRFIYHLTYYRILHTAYAQYKIQSEFWTHSIDAHLLYAAITWCMVFGSHGCNPTHWKKLSQTQTEDVISSFRNGLTKSLSVEEGEWKTYWEEMNYFRNNYAAHRAIDYNTPVPNFDLALKVAYYYDAWIRHVIQPDMFPEPSLQETAERVKQEITPLIDRLMAVTKECQKNSE